MNSVVMNVDMLTVFHVEHSTKIWIVKSINFQFSEETIQFL